MKKTTFNNLNAVKIGMTKDQLIEALTQKNLKGGGIGTCPPPWEVDQV